MDVLFFVERKNYKRLEEDLKKDDLVSGASITIREASDFGRNGFYFLIEGTDDKIEKAREIARNVAIEIEKEEKKKVIEKIREEEERALEGFGFLGI